MLVELTTWRATERGVNRPGDVVELPDEEAASMIRTQQALPVAAVSPEAAVTAPTERRKRGRPSHNR